MLLAHARFFAFCSSTGYFLFVSVYVPKCVTSKTMQIFYRCAKTVCGRDVWALGDVNDLTICDVRLPVKAELSNCYEMMSHTEYVSRSGLPLVPLPG